MRSRQPSETFRIRGRLVFCRAALEEGEFVRIEQLAAARLDEMRRVALVDQPEQRQQTAPTAAALVHGVRVERGVLDQRGVKTPHGIAGLVDLARSPVRARRQEIAVFGIEHEDQAHQHRQQAFIEVVRA